MSEMMVLGFENEMEADRFGLTLAELQKSMIVQVQDAADGATARLVRSNLTAEQEAELKHAFGAKRHTKA